MAMADWSCALAPPRLPRARCSYWACCTGRIPSSVARGKNHSGLVLLVARAIESSTAFQQATAHASSKGRCFLSRSLVESSTSGIYRSIPAKAFDHTADAAAHEDDNAETSTSVPEASLQEKSRAVLFYLTATIVSIPLFVVMVLQQPLVLLFDRHRRKAQHLINKLWASLSSFFFYKVEIIGRENLPHPDEAAVYIANHQSFIDIFALFHLGRPFKFISKTSVFLIPIIGWAMYLTGHIPLRRMDTKSQLECLRRCIELLKTGVPVFFFPEGTRSPDGELAAFKKGAFTAAVKAKVPVIPITLVGTNKLMPTGKEHVLRTGDVKIVVSPPFREGSADELCVQARDCIADTLSRYGAAR